MLIFVDIDDVVWDLLKYWVEMLNEEHHLDVKVSDINNFDMRLFFPTLTDEEIYAPLKGSELWRRVRLKPNADTVIKRLMEEGHDVRFATATHYMNVKPKFEMLQFYLPFVSWDSVIVTRDKSILMGDVIIDDWKNNVINSRCPFKLLFDMPHNANVDCEENGLVRVYGWEDIYDEIHAVFDQNKSIVDWREYDPVGLQNDIDLAVIEQRPTARIDEEGCDEV